MNQLLLFGTQLMYWGENYDEFENNKDAMFVVLAMFIMYAAIYIGVMLIFVFVIAYIIYLARAFDLAGEAWWKALIPYYNTWTLSKLATGKGWYIFLLFVPCLNLVAMVYILSCFGMSFGMSQTKSVIYGIFAITVFPIVAYPETYRYSGPVDPLGSSLNI